MLENSPSQKDEALSKLLKTWKPEAQLPPRFQETVWHRIEFAETVPSRGFLQTFGGWIEKIFARPALAVAYVAILLFTGVGAGYWHAEGRAVQATSEMRSRYVQSVDPYQMTRR